MYMLRLSSTMAASAVTTGLLLILSAATAAASDGVVEINQTCATSVAGCFPGDAGGFPVTIGTPGSYRLTGNLTVSAVTDAIEIVTSLVTLDLGGFTIAGPVTCTGFPVSACGNFGTQNFGVGGRGFFGITVRNGTIRGFPGSGVLLDDQATVEDLLTFWNSANGIGVGNFSRVTRCRANVNGDNGIAAGARSVVENSQATANGNDGIILSESAVVRHSQASDNKYDGIRVTSIIFPPLIHDNVLQGNGAFPIIGGVLGFVSQGNNLCDGTLC